MIEISIRPEVIGHLGPIPITNSLITTYLVIGIILLATSRGLSKLKNIPSRIQVLGETVLETWLSLCDSVAGSKSRRYFPLITTLFIFILLSNWLGLLPGLSAIGIRHFEDGKSSLLPILRAPTSDLNTTLALAIVSFFYIEIEGIRSLGLKLHLHKFFVNPINDPMGFFIGLLELLSEFTRIVSFSFRLFGNVFAGEVLLAIMTFLIPLLVPIPFLGLEIFTSFIQAYVFAMLTLVFISMATLSHSVEHKESGGD